MRRSLGWIAGALGLAGAIRALRRQRALPLEAPDPRAEELRRRLEEAKPAVGERDRFEAGETPVDEAPDPQVPDPVPPVPAPEPVPDPLPQPPDPDARRRDVHDRARSAIDDMRRG